MHKQVSVQSCCFCKEFASPSDSEFSTIFGSASTNRLLAATDSFALLPSLGPITEGHLLLLPFSHMNSFAELKGMLGPQAIDAISGVRNWLMERFGSVVIFEHGTPSGAMTGGCGITHAHIHFVPVGSSDIPLPADPGLSWQPLYDADYLDAIRIAGGATEGYLFFETISGERYFSLAPSTPSQFLRRHVANCLGGVPWNWREHADDMRALKPLTWPQSHLSRCASYWHGC